MPSANAVLQLIPPRIVKMMRSSAKVETIEFGKPIHCDPGKILFVESGAVSLIHRGLSHELEVALIGQETLLPFNGPMADSSLVVLGRLPGQALLMSIDKLGRSKSVMSFLNHAIGELGYSLAEGVAQTALCFRFHTLPQRMAAILLMLHQISEADYFPLTQKYMAYLVGAERANVAKILKNLYDSGLVGYQRHELAILDEEELRRRACDCYIVRAEARRRAVQRLKELAAHYFDTGRKHRS